MQWYKSRHGTAMDSRYLAVAGIAGSRPGDVAAVWHSTLDFASRHPDRGSIEGLDSRIVAAFFRLKPATVDAILGGFHELGMIAGNRVSEWTADQETPEKDVSASRTRRWRERQKDAGASTQSRGDNGSVTAGDGPTVTAPSPDRHGDGGVTAGDGPVTARDGDLDLNIDAERKDAAASLTRAREREAEPEGFEQWWSEYPHKVGKTDAIKAYRQALKKKASVGELLAAMRRYKESKPGERAWCNPATWLNGARWLDQPAPNDGRTASHGRGGGILGAGKLALVA